MIVYGFDSIESLLAEEGYLLKMIANDSGVAIFRHTTEHRDATQPGLRYADDSKGNALAAMVMPSRIEFRFHREFSDDRVTSLASRILSLPEFGFARSFEVVYQGRTLVPRAAGGT